MRRQGTEERRLKTYRIHGWSVQSKRLSISDLLCKVAFVEECIHYPVLGSCVLSIPHPLHPKDLLPNQLSGLEIEELKGEEFVESEQRQESEEHTFVLSSPLPLDERQLFFHFDRLSKIRSMRFSRVSGSDYRQCKISFYEKDMLAVFHPSEASEYSTIVNDKIIHVSKLPKTQSKPTFQKQRKLDFVHKSANRCGQRSLAAGILSPTKMDFPAVLLNMKFETQVKLECSKRRERELQEWERSKVRSSLRGGLFTKAETNLYAPLSSTSRRECKMSLRESSLQVRDPMDAILVPEGFDCRSYLSQEGESDGFTTKEPEEDEMSPDQATNRKGSQGDPWKAEPCSGDNYRQNLTFRGETTRDCYEQEGTGRKKRGKSRDTRLSEGQRSLSGQMLAVEEGYPPAGQYASDPHNSARLGDSARARSVPSVKPDRSFVFSL